MITSRDTIINMGNRKDNLPNLGIYAIKGISPNIGKKRPKHVVKVLKQRTGSKNPAWKGNNVGYIQLHNWVKKQLVTPKKCPKCQSNKYRLELANITGIYNRELKNWSWLCARCHRLLDENIPSFKGKRHSIETRQKMSATARKRKRNKNGRFI